MGFCQQKYALVALDAVLIVLAYGAAFWLRLDAAAFHAALPTLLSTLPVLLAISLFVHLKQGLFHAVLRYASTEMVVAVVQSVAVSTGLSAVVLLWVFRAGEVPASILLIHGMAILILVGGSRIGLRLKRDRRRAPSLSRCVVLCGLGDTAELALRGLRASPELGYEIIGVLDTNRRQHGRQVRGVTVLGGLEELPRILEDGRVDELWICEPEWLGERLRGIYDITRDARPAESEQRSVRVKILPKLQDALLGDDIGKLQEPDIADLLKRPQRCLDHAAMRDWVEERRVLITGAGGSIGSELARQIAKLGPASITLCDASEASLFEIHRELEGSSAEVRPTPYLIDVRDAAGVARMFRESRPDIVFHAAAYKHVPLVELHPCEGVRTNVQGLCNVALAAAEFEVSHFVFISTDKAVRPVNVMGSTKRLGERIIQSLDSSESTRFIAVRFGNVLGSSGSAIPIFREQIERGGPVTVTHPDMTRYFMLVSEAVELVIQAGCIGRGGEVFILDMGEPVRIADMARDLIRLLGKEPDHEVKIEFTGPRPGEKIFEELLISSDDSRTSFQDIWIEGERRESQHWTSLYPELRQLFQYASRGDRRRTLQCLAELVPSFRPAYERTRGALDAPSRVGFRERSLVAESVDSPVPSFEEVGYTRAADPLVDGSDATSQA